MQLIEKILVKCKVWRWELLSLKLRNHKWEYAVLALDWELNKDLGTVSIVCDKKEKFW